jgi:hypothetical protein
MKMTKAIRGRRGRGANNNAKQLLDVLRLYISVALQQKTANFKVASRSRAIQCSALTEEKQKNQFTA